jgi:hypothetical protein
MFWPDLAWNEVFMKLTATQNFSRPSRVGGMTSPAKSIRLNPHFLYDYDTPCTSPTA